MEGWDCFIIIRFNGYSLIVKSNSGKPYEGKPHVRFDEGTPETG
jgi:hypothetical protein